MVFDSITADGGMVHPSVWRRDRHCLPTFPPCALKRLLAFGKVENNALEGLKWGDMVDKLFMFALFY